MKKLLLTILVLFFGFQSSNSQTACGGQFIDSGGINGNYQNNEIITTTICSDNPLDSVTITFTSFSLDINDTLSIYNGTDASSSLLGTFTGTNLPNAVTSASGGCLTFVFQSNSSVVSDGWVAEITCAPNPCAVFVNSATLAFCDPFELPLYDLDSAIPQILNGQTDLTVTFHQTYTDALTGSFPLQSLYIPVISQGQEIVFVRVTNDTMPNCYAITTLVLNTNTCNVFCATPTTLTISGVTSTSLVINWTPPQNPAGNSAEFWDIIALPTGSPAPTNTTQGFITSSSNPFIFAGLMPNTCYSFYVRAICSTISRSDWSLPVDICMPDCNENGTCGNVIYLNSFLDSNNNGIKDTNEVDFNLGNFVYQLNNSGINLEAYSNNGNYAIYDDNLTNNYDLSYEINSDLSSYYSCSTTFNNINVESNNGTTYYFPITVTQPIVDASVTIFNANNPVPGFQYQVIASYTNNGTQPISSGTLTFTKDVNLPLIEISETGAILSSTGFTYNFTNLLPFETRLILITFQMPTIPTVSLGQLVTNSIIIDITNDENISNNSSSLTQVIIGSYDPNDISESHGEKIVYSNFTTNDYLYYTIRFENTGTANAQFINVENTLDSKLDETTFEMVNASHEVNVLADNSNLKFRFLNINLPPTSTQPNDSHGYITYKIKPKPEYAIGDIIPNFANIYFDYNPAITTNTFNTEFVETLANSTFNENDFAIYPNPANNWITINLINNAETINSVTIYDVFGKRIKEIHSNSSTNLSVDVANLSQGIYIVELETESSLIIKKKLIIE